MKLSIIILMIAMAGVACQAQTNNKMSNQNNPLLCDPVKGFCETPTDSADSNAVLEKTEHTIKVVYFTDPICSSCWGIEPQLRKLKLEYGGNIEVEYRMGGLLPDWSYNSGGISKPSDVAHHWDEVSAYYDMPIDGDVWLEDPLHSSYPPSIAFKAAQIQDAEKALLFLREIREMVFLQKKNITKWEYLAQAAVNVDLNVKQLKADYEGNAKKLFAEDLKLGKELGVRGFPTMFFQNNANQTEIVYGSKPYTAFEKAVLKLAPSLAKHIYDKTWLAVFSKYHSLTAKEFAELSETPRSEAEKTLNRLVEQGHLEKLTTKNGSIWFFKLVNK